MYFTDVEFIKGKHLRKWICLYILAYFPICPILAGWEVRMRISGTSVLVTASAAAAAGCCLILLFLIAADDRRQSRIPCGLIYRLLSASVLLRACLSLAAGELGQNTTEADRIGSLAGWSIADGKLNRITAWIPESAAGWIILGILMLFVYYFSRGEGIGGGDVRLAMTGGFLLGPEGGMTALFAACILALPEGLRVRYRSGMARNIRSFPFGPYLTAGIWIMLVRQMLGM